MGHRSVADQLSWCGAGSSSVGSFSQLFRATQSLCIKKAFFTLLVGLSTAGMYPMYPEMYCVCDPQLQRFAAHIRPVVVGISGRQSFPSLEVLPSRLGLPAGLALWGMSQHQWHSGPSFHHQSYVNLRLIGVSCPFPVSHVPNLSLQQLRFVQTITQIRVRQSGSTPESFSFKV